MFTRRFTAVADHPVPVSVPVTVSLNDWRRTIEAPATWSPRACLIAASKYMRPSETSVTGMIERVVAPIVRWGIGDGYFTGDEAEVFHDELFAILVTQRASFNSPVWFNVGHDEKPQCSACFILKVEDTMESLLKWNRDEGMIFKLGSGSGTNLSRVRSRHESLSGKGMASGPLSFMKGADAWAGAIKSGGKTRRAAKMVILNVDHPDIEDFIWCKVHEERKAKALLAAGYSGGLDGEAYSTVSYQNANNSVGIFDEFMRAAAARAPWRTTLRLAPYSTFKQYPDAVRLLWDIATAAWECGDPGLFFIDTVNAWHTNPKAGSINSSNPCGEYLHVDETACNLASLNLLKFISGERKPRFLIEDFQHTIDVMITAMDILVGHASYPTPTIERNAHTLRELGLGFSNLGALLMTLGLPYDSDDGRMVAASITALLGGQAYVRSSQLGALLQPADGLESEAMHRVLCQHENACEQIGLGPGVTHFAGPILDEAASCWRLAAQCAAQMRNTQTTVIAPTGTISFLMDCDTTGIEPLPALVTDKQLVGGGTLHLEPQCVLEAQRRGAEREVFATAFGSENVLSPEAHIRMVAACQPFISGGISKTINLPESATVDDIVRAYTLAWELGLKAVSVYRNNSKGVQVISDGSAVVRAETTSGMNGSAVVGAETSTNGNGSAVVSAETGTRTGVPVYHRRRLPEERVSRTHKFDIAGHEGYLTVGLYDDEQPGEIFVTMSKQGSTIAGLLDSWAIGISLSLQHGVPLKALVDKYKFTRFEPSGYTKHEAIHYATSIPDYIMRWLAWRFLPPVEIARPINGNGEVHLPHPVSHCAPSIDGMPCRCGALMYRQGTCYVCSQCGETEGSC